MQIATKNKPPHKNKKINERFVRWQQRSIEEMGKSIHLFLTIAIATVGYTANHLTELDFKFKNFLDKVSILLGIVLLSVSIGFFLFTILNRQKDFKKTTEIIRVRYSEQNQDLIKNISKETQEIGKKTQKLFYFSINFFAFGELLIILGFVIQICNKVC